MPNSDRLELESYGQLFKSESLLLDKKNRAQATEQSPIQERYFLEFFMSTYINLLF